MKKLTLLMAALFLAGFTFAQNTATTTVTGNNNNSDIDQTGGNQVTTVTQTGDYNDSDVDQFTNNFGPQVSTVIQTGDRNEATVDMDQVGGGGTTQNDSYIEQLGDWNDSYQKVYAPGSNSGDDVWGKQEGNHNDLVQIINTGYTNFLKSTQTGDYNKADQRSLGGNYHTGVVETDGDWNEAYQTMIGAKANLKIDQDGDRNYAKQDFRGSFGFTPMNYGMITQEGDWNDAYQYMTSGQYGNDMDLLQYGNGNYSYQRLAGNDNKTDIEVFGHYNDTRTYQDGDDNKAVAKVGASAYTSSRNDVLVDQDGDGNDASFALTRGDWNDVKMYQDGDYNYTEFSIKYGSRNEAYYDVDGTSNRSRISIDAPWGTSSDYNDLYVKQDGSTNYATGKIQGDFNDVDLRQDGSLNLIGNDWYTKDGVVIMGDHNTVDVDQTGTGHSSFTNITGNWNVSSTTQN